MDVVHRARLGDTLAAIAWDYAVPLDELLRFNGIKHPAFLWVGQEVRIPNACSVMPPVPTGLGEEPPDAPVDVAHFSTAMKVSKALELSWKSWPGQVAEFARDAFSDPTFLVTLVMIMGVYVGLWLTPDPTMITKLLAGTLTVVLLAQFAWEDIYGLAQAWFKLGVECERATTQAQLQKAGDTFARKVGQVGFDLLLFLVMWRAGKAAEPRLRDLGLKRMEARAEAKVVAAEALPGSEVTRQADGHSPDVWGTARQRARSSNSTHVLDELSRMVPEASQKGLAYMRANLGDVKTMDILERTSAKGTDVSSTLSHKGVSTAQRAVAKTAMVKAYGQRARLQMLRAKTLSDPILRKAMREESARYLMKMVESLESPPDWAKIRKAIENKNIDGVTGELGEAIQRSILTEQYPANKGYRLFANVEAVRLVKEFSATADWQAAERMAGRDGQPNGLYDWNGALWKSVTEMDAVISKKSTAGRWRPVELEQMKTGKNDRHAEAQQQNAKAIEAMKKVAAGDPNFRLAERVEKNVLGRDLSGEFDLSRIQEVSCSTRGLLGKQFDRTIPFERDVLYEVAVSVQGKGLPYTPPAVPPVRGQQSRR